MTDATFWPGLRITGGRLWIDEPIEIARYGDGVVQRASLGDAVWRGEVALSRHGHAVQTAFEARIAKFMRPGLAFLAYDPRANGPQSDPGGVTLGAATPVIDTLDADNRRLKISGLPAGYELRAGDMIGWQYLTSPTRYALHRIASDATADGAGLTPLFEVEPFIAPGVTTGAAVQLVRPVAKMVLTGGTYGQWALIVSEGGTVQFEQSFR